MIKINLKEHENTIDAYAELEQVILEEREGQLQELTRIKGAWIGPAAMALQVQYPAMLTSGAYQTALEQVTGMRQTMEEALPELKRLKGKCESFPACIGGTAGSNTTGILKLDETVIPTIDGYCDTIKSNSDQLKSVLQAIMNKCSGLVDFGGDHTALDMACQKIDKIIDLKVEIDDYKKCVEDIDADLKVAYSIWSNHKESIVNTNDIKEISDSSEIELERIQKLKGILKKDIAEISSADRRSLAEILVAIENDLKSKSSISIEKAITELKEYRQVFFDFCYDSDGILCRVSSTEWIDIVQSGFESKRQDIVQFLEELKAVSGENVKETIENLDTMTGGRLKRDIYHIITYLAESGIKKKVEAIYDLQPGIYRPAQKFAVNNILSQIPSELEGYIINDLAGSLTKGLLGFNYDVENDCYYTTEGSLQNAWGFGAAIDEMAPLLGMDLYHKDIVFQSGNREYLIELWKGEYGWGVTSGGEVGIYTRPIEEAMMNPYIEGEENFDIYYDCADDEDQLRIITTMYDTSGKEKKEICSRDTADYTEDGLDYWNLNFKSFYAADKEDIEMAVSIEGDEEIIKMLTDKLQDISEIEIDKTDTSIDKVVFIWKAESEIKNEN